MCLDASGSETDQVWMCPADKFGFRALRVQFCIEDRARTPTESKSWQHMQRNEHRVVSNACLGGGRGGANTRNITRLPETAIVRQRGCRNSHHSTWPLFCSKSCLWRNLVCCFLSCFFRIPVQALPPCLRTPWNAFLFVPPTPQFFANPISSPLILNPNPLDIPKPESPSTTTSLTPKSPNPKTLNPNP